MKFEVKDGCFRYEKGREILRNISFVFEEAGILSVLGANGAGKTTLMKCMLGLLPWTSGGPIWMGRTSGIVRQKKFWRRVGLCAPSEISFLCLYGRGTGGHGAQCALGAVCPAGGEGLGEVDESLETVGIAHLKNKLCNQISGGEYQLALIARALVTEPSLLILDEPESNLDFKNQMIVLEVLKRLCGEKKLSAIINTHFLNMQWKFPAGPCY